MHITKALAAYRTQKAGAKKRGIEFKLTFKEWCDWWGEDIHQRGRGANQLQMQRIHDKGAYELGNIIKGSPRQNMRTAGCMLRNKTVNADGREHQERLDAAMIAPSLEENDFDKEEDDPWGLHMLGYVVSDSRNIFHRTPIRR